MHLNCVAIIQHTVITRDPHENGFLMIDRVFIKNDILRFRKVFHNDMIDVNPKDGIKENL